MKKIIVILFLVFICGCTSSGNESLKKGVNLEDYSNYSNSIVYDSLFDAWEYSEKNGIDVYAFKERKEILNFTNNITVDYILENAIYLNKMPDGISVLFGSDAFTYEKTIDEYNYDYVYYGALNNEYEPDGIGLILEPYDIDKYRLTYIGYFEDGKYSGYGIKSLQASEGRVLNEYPYVIISNAVHEGYFDKMISSGIGNQYLRTTRSINGENVKKFDIDTGEFENESWNGVMKSYFGDILTYEGETKDGNYHGEGVEYYLTGAIHYKGEFKNGDYHGKGILYDETGKVIHEGEFSCGDIK